MFLLCEMAVQGYTASGWGDYGWGVGDLGAGWVLVWVWGVGWGALIVPFPLTAGLPLMGSPSCRTNSPSGLREPPPT